MNVYELSNDLCCAWEPLTNLCNKCMIRRDEIAALQQHEETEMGYADNIEICELCDEWKPLNEFPALGRIEFCLTCLKDAEKFTMESLMDLR